MLSQRSLQELDRSNTCHNERALLLQALDRDSSETLYCFYCHKLHVLSRRHEDVLDAGEMYRRVSEGRCLRGEGTYNYGCVTTYHAGFKFEHFQMAMKLYRRGLLADAKAVLTHTAFLQPARGDLTTGPAYKGLYFFEPRLVNGRISVRAQSWILIPGGQGVVMPSRHWTTVCAHLNGNYPFRNQYTAIFRCQLEHLVAKQVSCEGCCSLIRCHSCATEVRVEAKRLDEEFKGNFLVITKWQLLGCGLSPSEAHWRSHLERSGLPRSHLPYCAPPGDIRASYEDQPGTKYDSLLKPAEALNLL